MSSLCIRIYGNYCRDGSTSADALLAFITVSISPTLVFIGRKNVMSWCAGVPVICLNWIGSKVLMDIRNVGNINGWSMKNLWVFRLWFNQIRTFYRDNSITDNIDLVFKRHTHFVAMGIKKFHSKQFSESLKSLIFHMNLIA